MNPVFYILVLVAAFLLWLLLSSLYKPIGVICHKLWGDAKDAMSETDENENTNEKENVNE